MLKKTHLVQFCVAALAAATLFGACQKDNESVVEEPLLPGQIRLVPPASYTPASGDGSKMDITHTTSDAPSFSWSNGDEILINGEVCEVINGRISMQTPPSEGTTLYALYPASLLTENATMNTSTGQVNITVPSSYTYKKGADGKQNLEIPMVATATYNEEGTSLEFHHLMGAIALRIKNTTSDPISVKKLTLKVTRGTAGRGAKHFLYGSTNISISNSASLTASETIDNTSGETITMNFTEGDLTIASNSYGYVQIPVITVAKVHYTVTLETTHGNDIASKYSYLFERKKEMGTTAIEAGNICYFPITNTLSYYTTDSKPFFTVDNNGTQVRFAKGNLKYDFTNGFSVMDNQYDLLEVSNKKYAQGSDDNTHIGENNAMSLFFYGADGTNYPVRTMGVTTTNDAYMNPVTSDCNWSNALGNNWRVLSEAEWTYLLDSRGEGKLWAYAKVAGVVGIILFPDNYSETCTHFGLKNPSHALNATADGAFLDGTEMTSTEWKKYESAGCVFLPSTGKINNNGNSNLLSEVENRNTGNPVRTNEHASVAGLNYWTANHHKYVTFSSRWSTVDGIVSEKQFNDATTESFPIRLVQVVE